MKGQTHHTQIKMTEETWNGLKEKAAAAGLTVPSYIRWAVRGSEVSPADVLELTGELRKAERHLEQLLKRAEEGDRPGPEEYDRALEEVRTAERKIADAYAG